MKLLNWLSKYKRPVIAFDVSGSTDDWTQEVWEAIQHEIDDKIHIMTFDIEVVTYYPGLKFISLIEHDGIIKKTNGGTRYDPPISNLSQKQLKMNMMQ